MGLPTDADVTEKLSTKIGNEGEDTAPGWQRILPPARSPSEEIPDCGITRIESARARPCVEPNSGSLVRWAGLTHPWVRLTLTLRLALGLI